MIRTTASALAYLLSSLVAGIVGFGWSLASTVGSVCCRSRSSVARPSSARPG
ncbi:hypothetical protein NKG94_05300 [Micromonospora sp. M12]